MSTVLLTSGGTKTPIDSVRAITNFSKGTFGCHLCNSFLKNGDLVRFLYARDSKCPHEFRVDLKKVSSKDAMKQLVERMDFLEKFGVLYVPEEYSDFNGYANSLTNLVKLIQPDITVLAAAVSDYAPVKREGKISSELAKMVIEFEQTPKLIRQIRDIAPKTFLVGFKLLVGSTEEELLKAMKSQMEKAKTDMVIGNDLRDILADKHSLTVLRADGKVTRYSGKPGDKLADDMVGAITLLRERKMRQ